MWASPRPCKAAAEWVKSGYNHATFRIFKNGQFCRSDVIRNIQIFHVILVDIRAAGGKRDE